MMLASLQYHHSIGVQADSVCLTPDCGPEALRTGSIRAAHVVLTSYQIATAVDLTRVDLAVKLHSRI